MSGPKYRIVAVPKDPERRGGPGIECGSIWIGKFPGSLNLSPVKEATEGKYPKMPLSEALAGEYFLNVWPVSSPPAHDDF